VDDGISYELTRVRLSDGQETTLYVVRHPRHSTSVRVRSFSDPVRLDVWCAASGCAEAIVGGFFVRDPYRPLGEVRVGGRALDYEPIAGEWAAARGCVHVDGDVLRIAARADLGDAPGGDLLQAGPILVRDGASVIDGDDREGFSRGAAQFDSDITAERHPRCALGVSDDELLVACCDGRRSRVDAGLLLDELARLLISFGATDAINLDGGGSATLVHRGHLLNRPYSEYDQPSPASRPVVTALLFSQAG
jgi:Phosphodiester glycosidase